MNLINRFLVALLAIAWIGVLAVGLVLVWEQGRAIDWTTESFAFAFDITLDSESEQVLATIIIGALMLPAIALLFAQVLMRGRPSRDTRREEELAAHNRELERQLEAERARATPTATDEVVTGVREQPRQRQRGFRFLPGRR